MQTTISKDDRTFNVQVDVSKLPTDSRFRDLESALAIRTLVHRSAGYKALPDSVDTAAYIDAVNKSADGRGSGVLKEDREKASEIIAKLANASTDKLAAVGKVLGFNEPAATDEDSLARQFADLRIRKEREAEAAKAAAMNELLK
jgi:hypothetical protein